MVHEDHGHQGPSKSYHPKGRKLMLEISCIDVPIKILFAKENQLYVIKSGSKQTKVNNKNEDKASMISLLKRLL